MKIIVIIGANSAIGQQLSISLNDDFNNYRLIKSSRDVKNPYYLDLNQPETFHWLANFPNATFMICAAMTNVDECLAGPVKSHRVNVVNMKVLIDTILIHSGFPIFLSSSRVFSNTKSKMNFNSPLDPDSIYGEQKVKIEQYLLSLNRPYAVVRLAKVVSNNFPLFKKWQRQLCLEQRISAFNDFNIAPVLLSDVGELLALLCRERQSGIFQLSSETSLSYYDLAKRICILLGKNEQQVIATLFTEKFGSKSTASLMQNHWPSNYSAVTSIDDVLQHTLKSGR